MTRHPIAHALRAQARALDATADALERAESHSNGADEIVAIGDAPVERRALLRAIREGRLPSVRLGRKTYVRRSDLANLVPPSSPPSSLKASEPSPDGYASIVAIASRRRGAR